MNSEFSIRNILLIESRFHRLPDIDVTSPAVKNEVNINVDRHFGEKKIGITITVTFSSLKEKNKQVEALVSMFGEFGTDVDDQKVLQQFADINGPAIIFPFLREHLASMSLKAGIPPIMLPPINFIKLSASKTEGSEFLIHEKNSAYEDKNKPAV